MKAPKKVVFQNDGKMRRYIHVEEWDTTTQDEMLGLKSTWYKPKSQKACNSFPDIKEMVSMSRGSSATLKLLLEHAGWEETFTPPSRMHRSEALHVRCLSGQIKYVTRSIYELYKSFMEGEE